MVDSGRSSSASRKMSSFFSSSSMISWLLAGGSSFTGSLVSYRRWPAISFSLGMDSMLEKDDEYSLGGIGRSLGIVYTGEYMGAIPISFRSVST